MQHTELIYKERVEQFTTSLKKIKKRLTLLSSLRLVTFILIFLSVFYLIKTSVPIGIVASLVFLVLFFLQVKKFNLLQRKKSLVSNLLNINTDEISALHNKYDQYENGVGFSNSDHSYTNDLDIFGDGSLFQYLNRTSTYTGKQNLAACLSRPFLDIGLITRTQEAVRELIPRIDQRQNFLASGRLNSETADDLNEIREWLDEKGRYFNKKGYVFISYFFPVLSLIVVAATILNQVFLQYVVIVFLVQLFITAMHLRYNNRVHARLGKKVEIFRKYDDLLQIIENETYTSKLMTGLLNELRDNGSSASENIHKLAKLVSSFDSRMNLFAGTILNGFFLWDIQCMIRLERWRTTHTKDVYRWIGILGEYEVLSSVANFGFNNPGFVFPQPDINIVIDFKNCGHPLIHSRERVTNDITINSLGEFHIITGANMAGKSTFLRIVGVNLLLAMVGAPVCADQARFRPLKIFSSMRTSDSLKKNESYFYAELKRLKELIDLLRQGEKLFIVLDEILKGTNSTDKHKGSKAVLEQIVKLNGTGLIATHDLDLADMEKELPGNLKNKCFEIEINGTEIYFDYKLYNGITQKMNASLLMQQMGILTEK